MFGAISGAILLDLAKKGGYMQQLELLEPVPFIEIDLKYLSDDHVNYRWHGADGMGVMYSQNSACFEKVRRLLSDRGYIEIERNWSNGDRVLRPFYINRYSFKEGDKFCCAAAQQYTIRKFMETHEYDRRNPTHFMYGGDFVPKAELDW